jgi:DNA-binding HxlR family transcriptional regulator
MPSRPWTGYERFCPLARALDVIGERWTLVIVQELFKQPRRYGALHDRLPGIGTSVLADRLRRLERAGVVVREPGVVGAGVEYRLTERGEGLADALRALRRWGVGFLADPTADGAAGQSFDVTYVEGVETLADGRFQLVVDERPTTLYFAAGRLRQEPGAMSEPELVVRTTSAFLDRWAAGDADWDDGRTSGEVRVEGPAAAWPRWLAATGYLLRVAPDPIDEEDEHD